MNRACLIPKEPFVMNTNKVPHRPAAEFSSFLQPLPSSLAFYSMLSFLSLLCFLCHRILYTFCYLCFEYSFTLLFTYLNFIILQVSIRWLLSQRSRRKWQPTPVLLPGKSHGWRSLVGYSPRGHKESDTIKQLHFLREAFLDLPK